MTTLAAGSDGALGLLIALGIIAFIALLVWAHNNTVKRRKLWAEIAGRLGLSVVSEDHLDGNIEGSHAEVDTYSTGSGKNRRSYTRVRINGGLPNGLKLEREGFLSSFSEDIKTGDRLFDAAVRIRGDADLALAMFDAKTRTAVMGAVDTGWTFADATWTWTTGGYAGAEIEAVVQRGLVMARDMRERGNASASKLVERVKNDPDPGARKRCLEYLIERHPRSRELEIALEAGRLDLDSEVRIIAATKLADIPVLAGLASQRDLLVKVRAEALRETLAKPNEPEVVALVEALLLELSEGPMSAPLSVALMEALGVVPNERAESVLMNRLDAKDDNVQLAAMRSLGKIGTIDAVPVLMPYRDRFLAALSTSAEVAKDAILQIQARAGHAEAGALALAEVEGGLALADASTEQVEQTES